MLGASYDENRPAATFEACRSKDWVTTQSSHVVSRLCLSSQTPVIQRARSDTAISARRASRNTPGGSYDAMVRHGAPPASDRAPDWSRHLHLQVPRNRSFPCPNEHLPHPACCARHNEHPPTPCLLYMCPTQCSNFRGQTRSFHYTLLSVRTPHRFAPSLCLQEGVALETDNAHSVPPFPGTHRALA